MTNEKNENIPSDKVLLLASPLKQNHEPLTERDAFYLKKDEHGMVFFKIAKTEDNTIMSAEDEHTQFFHWASEPRNYQDGAFMPLLLGYDSSSSRVILGLLIDKKFLETKVAEPTILPHIYKQEYEVLEFVKHYLAEHEVMNIVKRRELLSDTLKNKITMQCIQSNDIGIFQLPADEIKVLGACVMTLDGSKNRMDAIYLNINKEKIVKTLSPKGGSKTLEELDDTQYYHNALKFCLEGSKAHINVIKDDTTRISYNKPVSYLRWMHSKTLEQKFEFIEANQKKFKDRLTLFKSNGQATDLSFSFEQNTALKIK